MAFNRYHHHHAGKAPLIKGNATSIHSQVTDAQETRQPTWVFTKHKHASVSALGTTTKKYSVHVEI